MNGEDTDVLISNYIASQIQIAIQQPDASAASNVIFNMWHNIGTTLWTNFGLGLSSITLTVTSKIGPVASTSALIQSSVNGCNANDSTCLKTFINFIYNNYINIINQLSGVDAAGNIFQSTISPSYHSRLINALNSKIDSVLSQYQSGPYFGSASEVVELHKKLARTLFKDADYVITPSDIAIYVITNPSGVTTTLPFPGSGHPYL